MILVPAVDIRGGACVRLAQGDFDRETVYDADPIAVAQRFAEAGAEWLHVVDLDAALEGVPRNRDIVARVIAAVGIPVQASGGIRDLAAVESLLRAGASRVVLGTAALRDLDLASQAVDIHGDAIAIGLDVRGERLQARGWTEDAGNLWETLDRLSAAGVRRFVVTDVERDGMLRGPNTQLLRAVIARTSASVLASGGVASLEDLSAVAATGAEGVVVGRAIYTGAFRLEDAIEASRDGR